MTSTPMGPRSTAQLSVQTGAQVPGLLPEPGCLLACQLAPCMHPKISGSEGGLWESVFQDTFLMMGVAGVPASSGTGSKVASALVVLNAKLGLNARHCQL